jgi:heat-inducible transcriptional repressor
MSDLEESGFIDHPHTSAGRVPTDKGYRYYVDSLMSIPKLKPKEKELIDSGFNTDFDETSDIVKVSSKLLSTITKQIACVTYPSLDSAMLDKLQIISIAANRILVVITIKSGLVKTITLEVSSDIRESQIDSVQRLLNERLSGLKFNEIRNTFKERFKDIRDEDKPVIRLFIDSADKIFKDEFSSDNLIITGVKNVIRQPEFEDPDKFQSVIELVEDKDIIIHIMEKSTEADYGNVFISIGSENNERKMTEYSFISKEYSFGGTKGTLGIVGPKRMEYNKIVAIVDYIAKMLSEFLTNQIK